MSSANLLSLLELAVEGAHAAGDLLLDRFGEPPEGVATKSTPTDLVSDADRDSEKLLIKHITDHRPDDGVLSEEGGGGSSSSGLTWVLDPLDGTINYLYGIPQWCVSVALEDSEGGLVGVIRDPNRNETFTAIRGEGSRLEGRILQVTTKSELAKALIGTGFSYDAGVRTAQAAVVSKALPLVRDIRRAGSAALDLAWVACGRLDGFYEADMNPWDRAAGELLVREAGGSVSDLKPVRGPGKGLFAANPNLHDQLRALVLG
jgi:myo-inositol-1(or 4)-monophosphatase